MRAVDVIVKKRDGGTLTSEEISFLIDGYMRGEVADEQMSAWAMAVLFRGMDERETADLTMAMVRSGNQLDLRDIAPVIVDKHSTGGIGDKTSLVLGPLLAASGMVVAKMSGRGLGFSGGTIDKLEAIPGFRTELTTHEFRNAARTIGLVIAAQSAELAPADKRLYALRDVTGTVESIPLIAASIMSKKLAAGAGCIALDVKYGRGAFMQTREDARRLAQTMISIGQHAGRRVTAVLSSMEQPLGLSVGNALEVREASATLQGAGPPDLVELCLTIGAELALLAGKATTSEQGRAMMQTTLASGSAWQLFRRFVANQGGDVTVIDEPERFPQAPIVHPLVAPRDGIVAAVDAMAFGIALNELGGGRRRKEDRIDHSVGIVLAAKIGDRVAAGAPLFYIHAASESSIAQVLPRLSTAYTIGDRATKPPPLIREILH